MGHAPPRHRAHPASSPPRWVKSQPTTDDLIAAARAEYVAGRIEVEDLEAALDHVYGGGLPTGRFAYLERAWLRARLRAEFEAYGATNRMIVLSEGVVIQERMRD